MALINIKLYWKTVINNKICFMGFYSNVVVHVICHTGMSGTIWRCKTTAQSLFFFLIWNKLKEPIYWNESLLWEGGWRGDTAGSITLPLVISHQSDTSICLSFIHKQCVLLCAHMAFVLVTEEAEWLLIATVGPLLGQSISSFSTTTASISRSVCFIQVLPLSSQDLRKATQLAHGVMMQYQGDITQRGGFHSYKRSMWEVPVAVLELCVVWFWSKRKLRVFVKYNFWF